MSAPTVGRETIPGHLPERLTIAFWFSYWATHTAPGDDFADLEGAFRDLVARGFNTVRIDGLWSWCFRPDGSRRPPLEIGRFAEPGYCNYGAGFLSRGGERVDVLPRLLEFFALARKYDVYVALTTWEYHPGHTLGFIADPAVRQEILDIPVPERFPYTATQIDRLLQVLKQEGLADRIAYVELHNEIEISLALGLPGGPAAVQKATEDQIAWLRARHPDMLVTGDHTLPCPEHGFDYRVTQDFLSGLPANAQLLDHHLYAWACGVQVALFREAGTGIGQGDLDVVIPRLAAENELYRWLLRPDAIPWDEYKRHLASDWFQQWWAPMYLYHNLDIGRWDYWMFTHYPRYEERMQGFWRNAIAVVGERARAQGVPLVCDEGYICWPPTHSQFESSAVGRANFDFIVDHMLEAGYWGYMVSTYAFPGQPLWEQEPDWLARTHARILTAG